MVIGSFCGQLKTADQAVTSSTTLTAITGLVVPLRAAQKYGFRAVLPFALAGVVSGYKFSVTGPSSPTNVIYRTAVENAVAGVLVGTTVGTALASAIAGALASIGNHIFTVEGVLENGSNAGNLGFQMAQNTSDGSAITVLRGGSLTVWCIP